MSETAELKKPEKKVSLWTTEEAGNIKSVYGFIFVYKVWFNCIY